MTHPVRPFQTLCLVCHAIDDVIVERRADGGTVYHCCQCGVQEAFDAEGRVLPPQKAPREAN